MKDDNSTTSQVICVDGCEESYEAVKCERSSMNGGDPNDGVCAVFENKKYPQIPESLDGEEGTKKAGDGGGRIRDECAFLNLPDIFT